MYNYYGDFMYNMEKLKSIRKANNYTIYDMANFLGITAAFYCQIENGKKRLEVSPIEKR